MANELYTRIALKYDSYDNWTKTDVEGKGGNLVLLPGEIGICQVNAASQQSNVVPTVLFKVGGAKYPETLDDGSIHPKAGQLMAFKDLPWASAKAADVYDWAKAKDVEVVETAVEGSDIKAKALKFTSAGGGLIKSIPIDYITPSEVTAITGAIAEDLSDVTGRVGNIEKALETLVGDETGSIADAIAAAELRAAADAASKADAAKTAAFGEAARLDGLTNARIDGVVENVNKNAEDIGKLNEDLAKETNAREAAIGTASAPAVGVEGEDGYKPAVVASGVYAVIEAGDKAINYKIGNTTDGKDDATVYGAIAAAIDSAATTAQNKIDTLVTSGAVKANTDAITELTEDVADINEAIADLQGVDEDFEGRIGRMEAFFGTADKDGEDTTPDKTVYDALDTLKEIQDFINTEASAADDMLTAINDNAEAIENAVGANGTITKAVAQNEENIGKVDERVGDLEDLTAGLGTDDSGNAVTVKAYVDAAKASAISTAAGDAASKANTAESNAKSHATSLNSAMSARVEILETAKGEHAEAIAGLEEALGKETKAREDAIGIPTDTSKNQTATGLYAVIEAGDKAINDKIGGSFTSTSGNTVADAISIANTAAGNAKAAADAAQNTANSAVATAGENAEAIGVIEGNYVRIGTDEKLYAGKSGTVMLVINCGSASDVI